MDFNRTVLVTGGSGFIGSHLVCSLVYRHPDWKIINLDNLDYCCSPKSLETVEDRANYTFIRGDVCNSGLVNNIFKTERINVIFHLAAKTHVESSFESPSIFQHVNVDGTRVLLRAAHEARHQPQRFIYISTDEVYGASLDEVFDETSPLKPSNPYSATKAAAECLVKSYWKKYKGKTVIAWLEGHNKEEHIMNESYRLYIKYCFAVLYYQFPIIITRSNNIYGPRQYTEKVIPRFLTLLQKNKKCTIQGTLPISRHFLFVNDAINAFLLLLEKGIIGEIYNVGTSCEVSIIHLARQLIKMVKNVPETEVNNWLEFVPDRPSVDLRYPITCEKLERLGWNAQVSWAEGIRNTVKWYQDNPSYWSDKNEDQDLIEGKPDEVTSK